MQSTTIRCSNCGQPIPMRVVSFIDAQKEPQLKNALIGQQINRQPCPNCNSVNQIAAPLLYHDPVKELLLAFVPMEMNLTKDQQERVLGDLMKMLPKDSFKAYMFNPKRSLTLQGMIETILNADGITPEIIEEAKQRSALVQRFVEAADEELASLITEYDAQIDVRFIQAFTAVAQRVLQAGRQDMAQAVLATQQLVLQHSTFGQKLAEQQVQQEIVVEEVAHELEALSEDAGISDFIAMIDRYAGDDARVQALVGLIRPLLDDNFFAALGKHIDAAPADRQAVLTETREKMRQVTAMIDQQNQMRLQASLQLLQGLMSAGPNMEQLLEANAHLVDETFLSVLSANIQEAENRRDVSISARLKQIYEMAMSMISNTMPPEVMLVNQLLSSDPETAAQLMAEGVAQFGPRLLDVIDAILQGVSAQGQEELADALVRLRADAETALAQQG
jgi:hypothetical protein